MFYSRKTNFFRIATLMVVALVCSFVTIAQTEIGLQLYSFRKELPKDVRGTMKAIRAMGITELEGGGTYGMALPDYKKMLDSLGFKMVSIGADFNKLQAGDIQGTIDQAKALGATYVMCAWIPHQGDNFTIDDAKKAVEVFNTVGKKFKENGLTFTYHAHGYEFGAYEGGTLFDYLAKNMNPEYANFEMDVFWIKHPGQDPVALLKKYPGRFKLMHLKDRKPGTEGNQGGHAPDETNVVLGSGDVGIAAIMKEAKKAGVKHFFIEDESPLSMQQVPQSLAYLKTLK